MEHLTQTTILIARAFQGISPIFVEYALWIAIFSIIVFAFGELISYLAPYKDKNKDWISSAFGVPVDCVIPIPHAFILGLETVDPHTGESNPFHLNNWLPMSHKADYLVRGELGAAFVSVYNWRGTRSRNTNESGVIEMSQTLKYSFFSGFRKAHVKFSPDDDTKRKSATLNLFMFTRFGSSAKICSICLHKNRNPILTTRTVSRDIHGRLAAHIDVEQIKVGKLPSGSGGYIDCETWMDMSNLIKSQTSRMMRPASTVARILTVFLLLGIFNITKSSSISVTDLYVLFEKIQMPQSQSHTG